MSADRLEGLLLHWEELVEQGQPASPEELCRDCPELLDELRRRVRALLALYPALGGPPTGNTAAASDTTPRAAAGPARPTNVPGYEILGELGRGGMGVVYKARHLALGRIVALKMVLAGAHAGAEQRRRFRAEAEAAALLSHPHIVQVYEVGEQDGCPFFSLEYVEGRNLQDVLSESRPAPAESAALVEQLARAVDYAHRRGVVHRDLKPANVLLSFGGDAERSAGDHALRSTSPLIECDSKITDFGIAKRLDAEQARTRTGDIMGTPSYMAPEQADGKPGKVGPATDIYALGAILYEMLSGAPPFEGLSAWETISLVISAEPVPPSRRKPGVPRDLETICLKCLEKQPLRRYTSALALADDLRRFLGREPIEARAVGRLERGVKWVRRRPALAALLAVSAAALLILLVGGWVAALAQSRNNRALRMAHHNLETADRANRAALVRLNVANGTHFLGDEDLFGSLIWFTRALKLEEDGTRERSHRTRIATVLRECPRLDQLWFYDEAVTDVAFSPDGKWVLTASNDHTAQVRDAVTGKLRFALRHRTPVLRASFSPDGAQVVTAADDGEAYVWDAAAGRRISTLTGHHGPVRDARFSPDGHRVVTAGADKTARVWDAASGVEVGSPLQHEGGVACGSFSPEGKKVLTASSDGSARLWLVEGGPGALVARFEHAGPVTDAAFSADGKHVATASEDGTARVWSAEGKPITGPLRHHGAVLRVAFRPDGLRVATASADLTALVWDARTGQAVISAVRHYSEVTCAAFSPDGTRLLTASDDNSARVWDAASGRPLTPPVPHNGVVNQAAFSPDGRRIATASKDTTARVYDLNPTGAAVGALEHGGPVLRVCFDKDGGRVLTASDDGTARLWDARTAKELAVLRGHIGAVYVAAFSCDGRRIVTAGADRTARVWDATDRRMIAVLGGHKGPVRAAAFSPDGARVVTVSETTARVWDAASGARITELGGRDGHPPEVLDAAFSPDGARVATGSADGTARLWDADGKPVGRAMHHKQGVARVTFSPDGRRLATASSDRTAQLWDATSGEALLERPLRHAGPVRDVSFSPDGGRVLTSSDDNTAQVWDVATGVPVLPPLRHFGSVEVARFSGNGERVATASDDNTGRVWDATSGEPLTPALGHRGWGRITDVAFSPTGDRFVTASADGTAQVWRLDRNDWPADDLEHLAELLGGCSIGADAGSLVPLDVRALHRLWDEVRTRHPEAVGPSP